MSRLTGIVRDISKRKKTDQKLFKDQAWLKALAFLLTIAEKKSGLGPMT